MPSMAPPTYTPRPPTKGGMPGWAIALIVVGALIPILGILSAVAIPSFMKYGRKAKTSEARVNLRRLQREVTAYWEQESAAGHAFPATTPWTPPGFACDQPGGKFRPDASAWSAPGWQALHFTLDDPHYFQYRVETAADGASVTLRARADLDCDGEFSSYELRLRAENGMLTNIPGMAIEREFE